MSCFQIGGVAVLVLAFFVLSVVLIYKLDRPKLWDHCARTLVQVAIAAGTVTVAIIIFEQQLAERDAQAFQQQKWIASAFLRSSVLQLVARSKQAVIMSATMIECDPEKPCKMTPEQIVSTMRDDLDKLDDESQKLLYFSVPFDRKDYWQMVRNAGPLIPDAFFDKLMDVLEDYDVGIELGHSLLKQTTLQYRQDKEKLPDGMLPPRLLEYHYNKVARLQLAEVNIVGSLVCYLSDRVNELRGQPFQNTEFGNSPEMPTCQPYSDNLKKAAAALKAPEKSRLPPEFLKDRKAAGTEQQ